MAEVQKFPNSPGVYLHKNSLNEVIYIGKAKNLKKRIASYFNKNDQDYKTQILVKNISTTDFIVTNNEIEALLLENRLINKHKPKYNIQLKDSNRYFYIQITKETFPRILVSRKTNNKDKFFGPYTISVSDLIKIIRNTFRLRVCSSKIPKRTCLYHDLNLCDAPCENKISQDDYKKRIDEVIKLISHGDENLKNQYHSQMLKASKNLDFEKALKLKKCIEVLDRLQQRQIVDLRYNSDQDVIGLATNKDKSNVVVLKIKKGVILKKESYTFISSNDLLNEFIKIYYSKNQSPSEIIVKDKFDEKLPQYFSNLWNRNVKILQPKSGTKRELVSLAIKNAYAKFNLEDPILIEIKEMLDLATLPKIIECFDISNFGESVIAGACVQFKNKQPNKSAWRTYNISGDFGQDDFRAIHQIIKRRYSKHTLPDLIIIDGGKLQVDFALKALSELGLSCNIVGLAKKEETIVFADGRCLKLNKRLEGSKLIIKIRDSVHKFAIGFSRNKFKKVYKKSVLDEIKGIGEKTKFDLLANFGSLENIKKAGFEELAEQIGGKRAKLVFEYFKI